jgi:hypothetical protein
MTAASGSAELAAGRHSLRKDIATLPAPEHQPVLAYKLLRVGKKIISTACDRQRHGGLFLKDANKKVRLGLFNASLGFSLCPYRQAGRPFRQPLTCLAWHCRSLI